MPTYELSFILRSMTRPEVISTLRRTASTILNKDGIIRKIENHGTRDLPHKISAHGIVHKSGSHFIMEFDAPPMTIVDLKEEYGRDIDIVRRHIFKVTPSEEVPCTLNDELQPPAYRPDVIKMMEAGEKSARNKKKFGYNSGFDYYPFQK